MSFQEIFIVYHAFLSTERFLNLTITGCRIRAHVPPPGNGEHARAISIALPRKLCSITRYSLLGSVGTDKMLNPSDIPALEPDYCQNPGPVYLMGTSAIAMSLFYLIMAKMRAHKDSPAVYNHGSILFMLIGMAVMGKALYSTHGSPVVSASVGWPQYMEDFPRWLSRSR